METVDVVWYPDAPDRRQVTLLENLWRQRVHASWCASLSTVLALPEDVVTEIARHLAPRVVDDAVDLTEGRYRLVPRP